MTGETRPRLACFGIEREAWEPEFARLAPDFDIRYWPDLGDPSEIDFAFTWNHPPGLWAPFTNLRGLFSYGAGVDGILRDPDLPPGVPVVRLVDTGLVAGMNEYVLMSVLRYHREAPAYSSLQQAARWAPLPSCEAQERVVGVMGLGQLGASCALMLSRFGFATRGWSRSYKALDGVQTWFGLDGLTGFLAGCQILICLLPLTEQTDGILNRSLFDRLARGAWLINVARGAHLVEADLTSALDEGRLAGATLDVFRTEPLAPDHPFWRDPRIIVTPHIAAPTVVRTAAPVLVANLRRVLAGKPPLNLVDPVSGY